MPQDSLCSNSGLDTMRKRRTAVKSVLKSLISFRDAQIKALDNTPENFRDSESFEIGDFAVSAIDDAIAILEDIYC